MISVKAIFKVFNDEGRRIFLIAILASLAWHVFWLSTITIVSRPEAGGSVKFSKVSFLGPILGKGSMELQAAPPERSFLEKRYLAASRGLLPQGEQGWSGRADSYEPGNDAYHLKDDRITAAIDKALGSEKLEPSSAE